MAAVNDDFKKGAALIDKMSTKFLVWFGTILTIAMFFFLPVFVFILVAFAPSFVAAVTDQERELSLTKCVSLCNFCGVLPLILQIVSENMDLEAVLVFMKDPFNWLIVLGTTAVGWGCYLIVPPVIAQIMRTKAKIRIEKLNTIREALKKIWGKEVFKKEKEDTQQSNRDQEKAAA